MNEQIKPIIEAALMSTSEPIKLEKLFHLFEADEKPTRDELLQVLDQLKKEYKHSSLALHELASGYCFQIKKAFIPYVQRLASEKPPRYSRATLETLALIVYRQPITRAEIEAVRGVSVSTSVIKSLVERGWIKVVGHKEMPGRPALYATTVEFLNYFNLKHLEELPDLDSLQSEETKEAL